MTGRVTAMTEVEAMELGYKVAAARAAILDPAAPGAMQAITSLGHDQRYYVMVRGWLMYQLQGDRSLLEANPGLPAVQVRVDFLERAIRLIDLE
jgi:hypothetical protein